MLNATFKLHLCFSTKSIVNHFKMTISGKHIGEMLKEAREQPKLTQEQLAIMLQEMKLYFNNRN